MLSLDYRALTEHFTLRSGVFTDPIFYANQPNSQPPVNSIWMRFSVIPGASQNHAGGAQDGVKKQLGRVWLQIFVPEQTGVGHAYDIADLFATMFRNKRIQDIISTQTEEINIVPDGGDGMLMMTVSIPYESYRSYL